MELTEKGHAGGFILSEANGTRSRENIVVSSVVAGALEAGTVLGKNTATGEYAQLDPGSTTGEQTAAGILYARVDATNGDVAGVAVVRDAEVNQHELVWPDDISTAQQDAAIASLAGLGIILR